MVKWARSPFPDPRSPRAPLQSRKGVAVEPTAPLDGQDATAWAVLVSDDIEFRNALQAILEDPASPARLTLAIDSPFRGIGDAEIQEISRAAPELVIVDLAPDPAGGVDFVQRLREQTGANVIVSTGLGIARDLLMGAMQSGVLGVLTTPLEAETVHDTLARALIRAVEPQPRKREEGEAFVLALIGAKGGVGTTTLATNLAVEIRRVTGKRVLLMDLDLQQGEMAVLLDMDPRFSLLDLLRNYEDVVADMLASCIEHHEPTGLDLLSAPLNASALQTEEVARVDADLLRKVLAFLRKQYDYIILDQPRSFPPDLKPVLDEVDEKFLIITPDLQALRNLARTLPRMGDRLMTPGPVPTRLVVNRYPPNHIITLKQIRETVGLDIYHVLGADFAHLDRAIRAGTPAVLEQNSPFSRDLQKLAARFLAEDGTDGSAGGGRGFLEGILDAVRRPR
jgi:pilus assembly protein CpaE